MQIELSGLSVDLIICSTCRCRIYLSIFRLFLVEPLLFVLFIEFSLSLKLNYARVLKVKRQSFDLSRSLSGQLFI